jgi:hypothetical protein
VEPLAAKYADPAYGPLVDDIVLHLERAVAILEGKAIPGPPVVNKEELRVLNDRVNALMEQRKAELDGTAVAGGEVRRRLSEFKPIADQFNFIVKVAADIEKLSAPLHTAITSPQEVGYTPLF